MRASSSKNLGKPKPAGSKKKPSPVAAKQLPKNSVLLKKKIAFAAKNVKRSNEKLMKKLEAMKKGEGDEDHPPTLSETFSRLTSMVAESVISERGAKKKTVKPAKPTVVKKAKEVNKKVTTKLKVSKGKKGEERSKAGEKPPLDKSEDVVKKLKNNEVAVGFSKGIGTRRKSGLDEEQTRSEEKGKKPSNKKDEKRSKSKPKVTAIAKKSPAAATKVESKPKKNNASKSPITKKSEKTVKFKSQGKNSSLKTAKKRNSTETDSSNSDEMTLDLFARKNIPKAKIEKNDVHPVKRERENDGDVERGKSVKVKTRKVTKPKKKEIESESSEDDSDFKRLLAKKLSKNRRLRRLKRSRTLEGEQRARRLRLFGFWSGPKRHRVASLNALAKVHCLYENEAKALGPDVEKQKIARKEVKKAEKELEFERLESVVINTRTLRGAPGTRGVGKHWEMGDSTSSASSDETSSETENSSSQKRKTVKREANKAATLVAQPPPKKRRNQELGTTMDLKDMVVRKRMASLNASAILAASYSFEKRSSSRKDSSESSLEESDTTSFSSNSPLSINSEEPRSKSLPLKKAGKSGSPKPKKNFWKTKVESLKKGGKEVRSSPSPILAEFEENLSEKVFEKEKKDKQDHSESKKKEEPRQKRKEDLKKINIEKVGRSADEYEYQSDSDTGQRKLIELRNAGGSNKKVAVIVNQDTDVTITGVYVNSTRSTHHEGYCSIAGMQYRISSTSHTQTEATAVISTSTASDQTPNSPSIDSTSRSSPRQHKSYTPLSALSSMQPPAAHSQIHSHVHGPSHVHSHSHRSHGCGIGRSPAGCSSAFSAPGCSKSPCEDGPTEHIGHPSFLKREDRPSSSDYYQPAGPLIHHHQNVPSATLGSGSKGQDRPNDLRTNRGASSEESVPETTAPMGYTRGLPPYQHSYYPPTGYYPPPPPPQPAHYQPQPPPSFHQHYHHHQDLCYPPGYPPGSYPPPPGSYRRYFPPPPPPPAFYPSNLNYTSPGPPSTSSQTPDDQVQQIVVPGGSTSYHPPLEPYPPHTPSGYYPGYSPAPGTGCFPHQPPRPARNIPFIDSAYQSCPCPMQNCPKNARTGPLTGECKRPGGAPVSSMPPALPPVVLALPQEPLLVGAAGPPSPARGSAGMPPLLLASPAANNSPGYPSSPHWSTNHGPAPAVEPIAPSGKMSATSQPLRENIEGGLLVISSDNLIVNTKDKKRKLSGEEQLEEVKGKKKKNEEVKRRKSSEVEKKTNKKTPVVDTISATIEAVIKNVRRRKSLSTSPPVLEPIRPVLISNNKKTPRSRGSGTTNGNPPHLELAVCQKRGKKGVVVGGPKWSNGWSWSGEGFDAKVYLRNDEPPVLRRCYSAMIHQEGDRIQPRDCVLLKAGQRKSDLPFVAKVSALWENPDDGEMMMSLLWYYRPEHTDSGRQPIDHPDEIFASRHKDINSVACIEDKCFVLTYNEYCRYRKQVRCLETGGRPRELVPRLENCSYPWRSRQPPGIVAPDIVFFCRKVYDFRQKRILKNPT